MHKIKENDNYLLSFGFMSTVLSFIKSCLSGGCSSQTSCLKRYLVATGECHGSRRLLASSGTYIVL